MTEKTATKTNKAKRYTEQFRRDAVELLAGGASVEKVALGLGVSPVSLRDWRRRMAGRADAPPGWTTEDLEAEVGGSPCFLTTSLAIRQPGERRVILSFYMAELDKKTSSVGNAEMAQRFVQFVMMQAQNIYYVLGRIPAQDGRPMPPNLEAAKILIDQLEMVQEKTRGNLSVQEGSILDDALKNVRLAFVEASGGTPASMMPKSNLPDFPMEEDESFAEPEAPAAVAETAAPAPAKVPEENKKKFTKSYG